MAIDRKKSEGSSLQCQPWFKDKWKHPVAHTAQGLLTVLVSRKLLTNSKEDAQKDYSAKLPSIKPQMRPSLNIHLFVMMANVGTWALVPLTSSSSKTEPRCQTQSWYMWRLKVDSVAFTATLYLPLWEGKCLGSKSLQVSSHGLAGSAGHIWKASQIRKGQ